MLIYIQPHEGDLQFTGRIWRMLAGLALQPLGGELILIVPFRLMWCCGITCCMATLGFSSLRYFVLWWVWQHNIISMRSNLYLVLHSADLDIPYHHVSSTSSLIGWFPTQLNHSHWFPKRQQQKILGVHGKAWYMHFSR